MAAGARAGHTPSRSRAHLGTHRPLGFHGATSALPQMRADDGDLARLTDRVWSLLFGANSAALALPLWRRAGLDRARQRRPAGPRPVTEDRLVMSWPSW